MDLIQKLVCDQSIRIGYEEILKHPWFGSLNPSRMKELKAPYIPHIKSELDTSNFDKYEEEEPWFTKGPKALKKEMTFVGYTYKMEDFDDKKPIQKALEELE